MNKLLKKVVGLALAATMVVGMGVVSFAAEADDLYSGTYAASVYDAGTYGTANQKLSMGDPAILNADVSYNEDEETTTIRVYTQSMTTASGITGSITGIDLGLDDSCRNYAATSETAAYIEIVVPGDYSTGTRVFTAAFTMSLSSGQHIPVRGDLVLEFPN